MRHHSRGTRGSRKKQVWRGIAGFYGLHRPRKPVLPRLTYSWAAVPIGGAVSPRRTNPANRALPPSEQALRSFEGQTGRLPTPRAAWWLRLFGSVNQKLGCSCFERFGEFRNHGDGRVPDLPLYAGYISAIDLSPRGKLFLRQVQPFPGCPDVFCQNRAHVFHAFDWLIMKTISPRTMSLIFCFRFIIVDYRLHRTSSGVMRCGMSLFKRFRGSC